MEEMMVKRLFMMAGLMFSWVVLAETPQANQVAAQVGDSGLASSIQVHGHWKLEVFDSDGTLVQMVEFDNELHSGGGSALTSLLKGGASAYGSGGMFVTLEYDLNGSGPCNILGSDNNCYIAPPDMILTGSYLAHSNNLSQTIKGTYDEILELKGSVTVENDSSLVGVGTYSKQCENITNAACLIFTGNFFVFPFTNKTLSPVVPVTAGQIVQVTITISFS